MRGIGPTSEPFGTFCGKLPLEALYEAIDITAARFPYKASYDSTKYFYGVCWRMVREREGR